MMDIEDFERAKRMLESQRGPPPILYYVATKREAAALRKQGVLEHEIVIRADRMPTS